MQADRIHVLFAHVGGEHELPGVLPLLAAQVQAQRHFRKLGGDGAGECLVVLSVLGGVGHQASQLF